VQHCPFCGAIESDRFDLEGHRYLVFACTFTPEVDPHLSEEELDRHLRSAYSAESGSGHFRQMCDRLHLYVAKGEGARALTGGSSDP
jgi:hypothetical protein